MKTAKSKLDALSIALLILLCASWGLNQVAIKAAVEQIPPVLQASLRSMGSALLLFIWMKYKKIPIFNRDGSLKAGILVGLVFTLEFILIFWGLKYTTASRSVIFINTSPFVVALGAQFFIPGERLTPLKFLGMVLAFAGIVFAFNDDMGSGNHTTLVGDIMLLTAALLWGTSTILIKTTTLARVPAAKTLLYQLSVSGLIMPFFSLAMGESLPALPQTMALVSLGYQIIWVAFITYLIWFWMLQVYPASLLAPFTFLSPLFGVLSGALLLGEPVTSHLIWSLSLVALGIYLVNRK
ncbi:MAG: DMT family transporter [Desulfobacterales bacterium]|nr:DMT family transporter [Desulfobacterales bacterium]